MVFFCSGMACPCFVYVGNGLQVCKLTANTLNKQLWTVSKHGGLIEAYLPLTIRRWYGIKCYTEFQTWISSLKRGSIGKPV